jgi:Protein of unknown function (DUF1638)
VPPRPEPAATPPGARGHATQVPRDDPARSGRRAATTLVIGCGALGRELMDVIRANGLDAVEVRCLPASLHVRPERIPAAVDARIRAARGRYTRIFVAYGDCGTGGALDRVLQAHGVERLPGAHCYQFFAGGAVFDRLAAEEPGTFYLTDFLARAFDRLVVEGLGLDRHPELLPVYFSGYRRVVYLSQRDDPAVLALAQRAATTLGLAFEHRRTGYGDLGTSVAALGGDPRALGAAPASDGAPALLAVGGAA